MGQPVTPMVDSRGLPHPWLKRQVEAAAPRGAEPAPAPPAWPSVMGPSGNGRRNLLRVLAGFLRPSGAPVEIDGPAWLGLDAEDADLIGRLVEQARAGVLQLTGEGGLLQQLGTRVLESAVQRVSTDHPDYDARAPMDHHGGESRHGLPYAVYPMIFMDSIHVKIGDGEGTNRPIYVALAVTAEGTRDILGLWANGCETASHPS